MIFQLRDPTRTGNPPVMPVQPTLFCHGRPFNTCTTGCLWRSLILKCHHPSAFYFETPNRTCGETQQILHVTSRSWLATKPCKVLHWSLVGFWDLLGAYSLYTHDLSVHKQTLLFSVFFCSLYRSIVILSVNKYQNPLCSLSVSMISIRTWHQYHTKRQQVL